MKKLILLLSLIPTLAAAETATQALAKLPPLASAASAGMDCSAQEATNKKVQAQVALLMKAPVAFGGSAVTEMTPAQTQAMAAIGDPAFNDCVTQLQANPAEYWVQPLRDKLQAKLEQVHAEYNKAYEAWCRVPPSDGCGNNPSLDKQFNAKAAAAGTQFLKDAQPGYAKYLKEAGDCITTRDKMMGGATGGGNNAMDALLASANGTTLGLVLLPAAANTQLCEAAREAARKYKPQGN